MAKQSINPVRNYKRAPGSVGVNSARKDDLGSRGYRSITVCAVLAGSLGLSAGQAMAIDLSDTNFRYGGYARAWSSFNLQDQPDTPDYDDKWKPSMLRGSLSLWAQMETGPISWRAVGRADRERLTSYERELEDQVQAGTPGGPGSDMVDLYNNEEIRELYGDFQIGRTFFRVGKQQVVWGETDFFHPTDLIHGYDYRWRSFLEPESDELRKPLVLANATIDVPELDGSLQVVVRPGLDRKEDIGNSYMQSGGRWMPQPYKGTDFLAGLTTYDYQHPEGDYEDVNGGLRWTGYSGSVNYAFSWLRTLHPDPVMNPAAAPYKKAPTGMIGDWFYPEIDAFAASMSTEVMAIDSIVSLELAYQKDRIFNAGITGAPPGTEGAIAPVEQKDVVATTLRIDKQLRLMDVLGTNAPSYASFQLFDTWIQDFDKSEEIVEAVGYANPARENTTIATFAVSFPYMNSRLTPGIAMGHFLQQGDTFLIPSISYSLGNNWRFYAEADLFFAQHERKDPASAEDRDTGGLGALNRSDQFLLRATYQF